MPSVLVGSGETPEIIEPILRSIIYKYNFKPAKSDKIVIIGCQSNTYSTSHMYLSHTKGHVVHEWDLPPASFIVNLPTNWNLIICTIELELLHYFD